MQTDYQKIRNAIERALSSGKRNFIIYPYGEYGVIAKLILNDSFGIKEDYIIDDKLSVFNSNIKSLNFCESIESIRYTVLFTCANPDIYNETLHNLERYFADNKIVKIFNYGGVKEQNDTIDEKNERIRKFRTKCGKSSYGSLCDHWLVESVGSFCSFAPGVDVVENHAVTYISTHPFLYYGGASDTVHGREWKDVKGERGYFDGINPKGDNYKLHRIKIGNDVWLGQNVLITNSANIGNGVIAGAGAVITKDVPDYAVVMGVPARIVRYRYAKEEIDALNKIAWWDWSNEKIIDNYDDFYLDIKDFINKHGVNLR